MTVAYKAMSERVPDTQHKKRLKMILKQGELIQETAQKKGALTCFGTLPPMVYDLANGFPVGTERKLSGFWKKPIAEIIAFIRGFRDISELEMLGCDFWKDYKGKGSKYNLSPDDLGPGSYGGAFHDFPMPDGSGFNQLAHVVEQIKRFPYIRTILVTPFIPYYIGRGGHQKAIVTPCHGMMYFRVINGRLDMRMDQRSADMPIGVPSNTIQYAALLMMMAQVTGLRVGKFIHSLGDAHIYTDQVDAVKVLVERPSHPFPVVKMDPSIKDLFSFRPEHFELTEYQSGPPLKISYIP